MFTDARISIAYRASVHLSARQLRAKQSYNRAFCRSSLHHDPDSAKSVGPKWVPTKNVGEASLAHNDLREHLDGPAVLRLLHFTNSTHT
jgi:hypothetical protein